MAAPKKERNLQQRQEGMAIKSFGVADLACGTILQRPNKTHIYIYI